MVYKMNRITVIQLIIYLLWGILILAIISSVLYESLKISKYFISILCICFIPIMILLLYKMCFKPFYIHFCLKNINDIEIITAEINKDESQILIPVNRSAELYKISTTYYDNGEIYVFEDMFFYNDHSYAKCIKRIFENEKLPPITVFVEKNNRRRYKMKSCEYISELKQLFPEYFM